MQRPTKQRSVNAEIVEGLRFLWSSRLLRTMAFLITIMAACWAAWIALIPVYAIDGPLARDAQEYGLLLTSRESPPRLARMHTRGSQSAAR